MMSFLPYRRYSMKPLSHNEANTVDICDTKELAPLKLAAAFIVSQALFIIDFVDYIFVLVIFKMQNYFGIKRCNLSLKFLIFGSGHSQSRENMKNFLTQQKIW